MEFMEQLKNFIRPELLVLVPVLYFIGMGLKKSESVNLSVVILSFSSDRYSGCKYSISANFIVYIYLLQTNIFSSTTLLSSLRYSHSLSGPIISIFIPLSG